MAAAANKLLRRCSLVLSVSGAQLFATGGAKIYSWTIRTGYFGSLLLILERFWGTFNSMTSISNISFLAFILMNIASVCFLIWNRKKLERLLTTFVHGITESEIMGLHDLVALAQDLRLLVVLLVSAVYLIPRLNSNMTLIEIQRLVVYSGCVSTSNWIAMTASFYWIAVQILFAYQKQQILLLKHGLSQTNVDCRKLRSVMNAIRQSFDAFEEVLSFLPLVWFLYGMIGGSASVCSLIRSPSNILTLAYGFRDYVPPLLVVVAVSRGVEMIAARIDLVRNTIALSTTIGTADKMLILSDLDSIKSKRLTGLSVFTLNRSFLVSYVGSVLTLAALMAGFSK